MTTVLPYNSLFGYAIAQCACPSSNGGPSDNSPTSPITAVADSPAFDTNYRSTVEIVSSCLTVIIASSWLCVHPNVTGVRTTMRQRLRERLLLFVIAILAPEAMAVFAYYQRIGCRTLYMEFEKRAKDLGLIRLPDSRISTPRSSTETLNDVDGQADETPHDPLPAGSRASISSQESEIPFKQEGASDEIGRCSTLQQIGNGIRSSFKRASCAILSFGTDPNEATWSHTHAHFVQMGGIAFRGDKGNVGFKWPKEWADEDLKRFFALKLTEAAISDKSKDGSLAKTLVVAQVLWFLVQVIARKVQGLPIALLEVASLAFIIFNFAMYACWWSKPLDVEYPLEVDGSPGGERTVCKDDVWEVPLGILRGAFDTIPIGSWIYSPTRQGYPRFYSFGKEVEMLKDDGRLSYDFDLKFRIAIAVTSAAFGAFHIIGWDLPAPSQEEFKLWRVACLGLTLYPLFLLILSIVFTKLTTFTSRKLKSHFDLESFRAFFAIVIGLPCGIAYIGARLAILLLPFLELRDLPPLVHRTVSWSRLISPI